SRLGQRQNRQQRGSFQYLNSLLNKKRNDAFHSALINGVFVRKMFEHQIFFAFEFQPETYEHEQQAQASAKMPHGDSGAGKHGKDSCVNRMTHDAVRPALDEFMSFFQRDHAAPVSSEYHSCPNGKYEAANAQKDTNPGA